MIESIQTGQALSALTYKALRWMPLLVDWDLGLEYHLCKLIFTSVRPKSHLTSKGALAKAAPLFPHWSANRRY